MHEVPRRSLLLAALLAVVMTASAEAQRRPGGPVRTSEGLVMIGGTRLDVGELNERLSAHAYPTFDEQFLQLGYARSMNRGPVRLGFELAGVGRPAATTADNLYRTRLGGGYAMLNVGYDVYNDGRFSVQPKIGAGGGALSLTITDRAAPSFDEVLAQPGRGVNLSAGSMLLDGSIGVRYRLAPRGQRALLLGVRGGYTQSLLHGDWSRRHADAPGGPTAGWGGPHFEFMIGHSLRR
jgi:hypothetical protein